MPKGAPRLAANLIIDHFDVSSAPTDLQEVLIRLIVSQNWCGDRDQAAEYASKWFEPVRKILVERLLQADNRGQHVPFAFNSISNYLIQGSSFAETADGDDVRLAKALRAEAGAFRDFLVGVTPREFEGVCRGILEKLGCESPRTTQYSSDQGIDFFGRLSLEGRLADAAVLPGLGRRLSVWVAGQAKHYKATQVSTPDLRELVGSVQLARTKTYADAGLSLEPFDLAPLDPVFYLFVTTGRISSDGWTLLERSGMIAMDGPMVVNFLTENGIGLASGKFDADSAKSWIGRQL